VRSVADKLCNPGSKRGILLGDTGTVIGPGHVAGKVAVRFEDGASLNEWSVWPGTICKAEVYDLAMIAEIAGNFRRGDRVCCKATKGVGASGTTSSLEDGQTGTVLGPGHADGRVLIRFSSSRRAWSMLPSQLVRAKKEASPPASRPGTKEAGGHEKNASSSPGHKKRQTKDDEVRERRLKLSGRRPADARPTSERKQEGKEEATERSEPKRLRAASCENGSRSPVIRSPREARQMSEQPVSLSPTREYRRSQSHTEILQAKEAEAPAEEVAASSASASASASAGPAASREAASAASSSSVEPIAADCAASTSASTDDPASNCAAE
jgi:hypothetical protein